MCVWNNVISSSLHQGFFVSECFEILIFGLRPYADLIPTCTKLAPANTARAPISAKLAPSRADGSSLISETVQVNSGWHLVLPCRCCVAPGLASRYSIGQTCAGSQRHQCHGRREVASAEFQHVANSRTPQPAAAHRVWQLSPRFALQCDLPSVSEL